MSLPMDYFRLTQCYYCFSFEHIKSNCPYISEQRYCARCGLNDHVRASCENPTKCIHCEGTHPATARCCPRYQQIFKQRYQELVQSIQEQIVASHPIYNPPNISNSLYNDMEYDEAWSRLQCMASAADSPDDFLNSLYTMAKANAPKNDYNPQSYNSDLNLSNDSLPPNKITFREVDVEEHTGEKPEEINCLKKIDKVIENKPPSCAFPDDFTLIPTYESKTPNAHLSSPYKITFTDTKCRGAYWRNA